MLRFPLLLAGIVALSVPGLESLAVAQEYDWERYQKQIEQRRKEYETRYQTWRRDHDTRNELWRKERGTDQDRALELSDSGLKPGSYTVRLPFGLNVRVNVPDAPAANDPQAWGERTYSDVYYRARQINGQLRDLHIDLQRADLAELTSESARIHEKGTALATAAAGRRPPAEIRSHFEDFDRLWHPFSHRLAHRPNTTASIQRRIAAVDQLEEGLHHILAISPSHPYDRPLVAALASELVHTTSHLADDLKIEPRKSADLFELQIRAQRVEKQASDLDKFVRQNASFATILEEYEEFDRAWHRLMEKAEGSPEIDAHLRRVGRQVRQIDSQLHRVLYVNAPIATDRQQLAHLSENIAKTADHLAMDLDVDTGRGKRELVDEARVFASIARDLNRVLTERHPAQVEQRAFKELYASWQRLSAQLNALKGDRFEHSQAVADQLTADIKRLQSHLQGT